MNVVLVMFRENGERRSFSLTRDVTVIGRREDADFRIPLSDVSRKHTRLIKDGHALLVEDLGSSNGTYHNGVRVQEAEVHPGDTLQIGPIQFVVQIDGVPSEDELLGNSGGTSTHLANNNFAMGGAALGGAAAMSGAEHDEELVDAGELEELQEVDEPLSLSDGPELDAPLSDAADADAAELDEIADFDESPVRPAVPFLSGQTSPPPPPAPVMPVVPHAGAFVESPEDDFVTDDLIIDDAVEGLADDHILADAPVAPVEEPAAEEVAEVAPAPEAAVDAETEAEVEVTADDVLTSEDVVTDTSALVSTSDDLIADSEEIVLTADDAITELEEPEEIDLAFAPAAETDEPQPIELPPLSLDDDESESAKSVPAAALPLAPPPPAPAPAVAAPAEEIIDAEHEVIEGAEIETVENESDDFIDIDLNAEPTDGDDDVLIDFGDTDQK